MEDKQHYELEAEYDKSVAQEILVSAGRVKELEEQVSDLKFELHQREYAVENSARLTSLAAELREALPDCGYCGRRLVEIEGVPDGDEE